MQKNRKKIERIEKLHKHIGELKCAYTKKKWLKFRIEQIITRGSLNFVAKGIKYLGPLETKWKIPYICPAVGQHGRNSSSVIWMYVRVKQKHVIETETVRKKAVFIKVHNFTYLEFDNIVSSNFRIRKLTKVGLARAWIELLESILITSFWRLIKRLRFNW